MAVLHLRADARRIPLADGSVHAVITSPPYFGLRDYGSGEQIGLELLHDCLGWARGEDCGECYVCTMRCVARELWRVLRDDGTLWLNLGDSYAATGRSGGGAQGRRWEVCGTDATGPRGGKWSPAPDGLKPKDLVGIPWRVALALQADGWTLRQDIIWAKPNPMPESVRDRCTKGHEYVFMLSKGPRYHCDMAAIREPAVYGNHPRTVLDNTPPPPPGASPHSGLRSAPGAEAGRNRRTVWAVATRPYAGAHFAAWPAALVEPMVLAGCPEGGVVLDPFAGSGTTGRVAVQHRRRAILLDLSREYIGLQRERASGVQVEMFD